MGFRRVVLQIPIANTFVNPEGYEQTMLFAFQALQAAAPSLPFLLLSGIESKGTACIAFSPSPSPLVSSQWLNAALRELGGKGGGKERSVGAAKDGTEKGLEMAVAAATAFAQVALK